MWLTFWGWNSHRREWKSSCSCTSFSILAYIYIYIYRLIEPTYLIITRIKKNDINDMDSTSHNLPLIIFWVLRFFSSHIHWCWKFIYKESLNVTLTNKMFQDFQMGLSPFGWIMLQIIRYQLKHKTSHYDSIKNTD